MRKQMGRRGRSIVGLLLTMAMALTFGTGMMTFAEETLSDDIISSLNGEEAQTGDTSDFTISADSAGYNKVDLKWDNTNLTTAAKLVIYRKVSDLDGEGYQQIKKLSVSKTKFQDTGLKNATNYAYYLKALDAEDTVVAISNEVQVMTRVSAPAQADLKAVLNASNQVKITWKAVGGAKRYYVDRLNSKGEWEPLTDNTLWNRTTYFDKEAQTKATTYIYRVTAARMNDYGKWIKGDSAKIICTPNIYKINTVGDPQHLGVTFSTSKGAVNYVIEHAFGKNKNYSRAKTVSNLNGTAVAPYFGDKVTSLNGIASEQFIDDGSSEEGDSFQPFMFGGYYFYRVYAKAYVDDEWITSKTSVAVKGRVTMDAPAMASISSNAYNHVRLVWEDMSEMDGTDSYQIWKSKSPYTGYEKINKIKVADTTDITAAQAGVSYNCVAYDLYNTTPERTYYYKVSAIKSGVSGALSTALSYKTLLKDVTKLDVKSANYNAMTLSFNAVPGATKYIIYKADALYGTDGLMLPSAQWNYKKLSAECTNKAKNGVVNFTISGLKHGKTYGFYVLPARNSSVHETAAAKIIRDYDFTRIKAPELSKVTSVGPKKITCTWKPVEKATYYYVECFRDANFSLVEQKLLVNGTTKSKTFDNLTTGQPYYFRVLAVCKENNVTATGDASNVRMEQPRPAPVTSLTVAYQDDDEGARLTWKKVKDDGCTYYVIDRSYGDKKHWKRIVDVTDKLSAVTYDDTDSKDDGNHIYYRVIGVYKDANYTAVGTTSDDAVKMFANPSKITLSDVTIGKGATAVLTVNFTPSDATSKKITKWTTSDDDYVELIQKDSDGDGDGYTKNFYKCKIKGLKNGSVTITATSENGKTAKCKVVVSSSKVIVLDPGHGGSDPGATYNGWSEREVNMFISNYTKERLQSYGFTVYQTRTSNSSNPSLAERAQFAKDKGAAVLVSQHLNASKYHDQVGVEVYKSMFDDSVKAGLAENILSYLTGLGIANRGVKTRQSEEGYYDYYGIIRESRNRGLPAIIVESAHMDSSDFSKFIYGDAKLKAIGYAQADGIAKYYGLK